MLSYRSEAAFSKALVAAMRRKGYFVQRIESGETGKGIPDIYVIAGKTAIWLELKRVKHKCSRYEVIPWRPGQQAWLYDVTKRGQKAYTVCCFDDCIAYISHENVFKQNVVDIANHKIYKDIQELLK